MLRGIAHNWEQNKAYERARDVKCFDNAVDAVDKVFGADRYGDGDDYKRNDGGPGGEDGLVLLFVAFFVGPSILRFDATILGCAFVLVEIFNVSS